MAGRPKQRADMVKLGEHEDAIFEALDEGKTQSAIAAEIGVMRSSLTRWLNANAERKAALHEARTLASEGLAEETLEIADAVKGIDNAEVQSAKLRIETRMKLAAVWNPERYGERQAGLTINVGSLHLDALRQAQAALPAVEVAHAIPALAEGVAGLQSIDGAIVDVEAMPVARDDEFGLM
jgi:transposase-like protein